MSPLRSFRDGVALVTGAASGIGLALSRALADEGAEVILADLQDPLAERHAEQIRRAGGRATAARLDVRDAEGIAALVGEITGRTGRIDYLFNNAGIGIGGEVRDYDVSVWNDTFEVNLRGVTNGIQAAYGTMIEQGFGHIVNTASMAGLLPMPLAACYAASKHAVVGLSLSMRIEAQRYGVRVSALCPGVIRTEILADGGKFGRLLPPMDEAEIRGAWEGLRPMCPDRFARRTLRAVRRNRALIIVPGWYRLFWWSQRLCGPATRWLGTRGFNAFRRRLSSGPNG